MANESAHIGPGPSALALEVQARRRKFQEWWATRESEWEPKRKRAAELHARIAAEAAERKTANRPQRPTSEQLPRPEEGRGGDKLTRRSSEKQHEKFEARDRPSPGIADALDGWNARKSPRPKSSGTTAVASIKVKPLMRDLSGIKAQKKHRESVSSSASPQSPLTSNRLPEWYTVLKPSAKRSAATGNADVLLERIKDQITMLKRMAPKTNNQKEMNELREMLHEAPFLAMGQSGPQLLRNKRMLHNDDGLPQIFDDNFATTMKGHWPWDVRSDAAELFQKWSAKVFDNDMLFGIIPAQKGKYAEDDRAADQVDKTYQVSSKYQGNGKLVNDGAHGDSQAGISGDAGVGAYSCFMSGGPKHIYPDEDHGDIVEYFGQDAATPGQMSRGTLLLMSNKRNNIPVRFIRSSKASTHSRYAPKFGFRYDGLYDVTSYELVDMSKERYKFRLVRQADQGPIRGGNGPEARPTKQEVERFKQDKRFRGF